MVPSLSFSFTAPLFLKPQTQKTSQELVTIADRQEVCKTFFVAGHFQNQIPETSLDRH